MSMMREGSRGAALWVWVGAYLVAYLAASALDLVTTELALMRPGSSEANVYATNSGVYSAEKAWLITAAGAAFMLPLFAFGVRNANTVSERWLNAPVRSFGTIYLNPFSRRFIDRAPLHAIAWAIAFVMFRLLAAINNALIAAAGAGPIGRAVRAVGRVTSAELGFIIVIGVMYVLLTIALSPWAAKIIKLIRHESS
jgi:hypothetical protein